MFFCSMSFPCFAVRGHSTSTPQPVVKFPHALLKSPTPTRRGVVSLGGQLKKLKKRTSLEHDRLTDRSCLSLLAFARSFISMASGQRCFKDGLTEEAQSTRLDDAIYSLLLYIVLYRCHLYSIYIYIYYTNIVCYIYITIDYRLL